MIAHFPSRRGLLSLAALLLSASLADPMLPRACAQDDLRALREGTHLFRHILNDTGLTPVTHVRQLDEDSQKKVLVVIGNTAGPAADGSGVALYLQGQLSAFIRQGGAALIASRAFALLHLDGSDEVTIAGETLELLPGSDSAYRKYKDCILVKATPEGQLLFRDAEKVVTYQPSFLLERRHALPVLGVFPGDLAHIGRHPTGSLAFAVGGSVGAGRILVLSDPSVFYNAVLWQRDNDNAYFARNCAEWLSEWGKRNEVLFFDGRIQNQFNIPLTPLPPPLPPIEAITRTADEILVGLEEEDRFNQLVRNIVGSMSGDALIRAVIVLVTAALALVGLHRLSHVRHRAASGPSLSEQLAQLVPRGSLLDERQRALLGADNFWETAQALARETLQPALATKRTAVPASPPSLQIAGNWSKRWRLRRQARQVWHLAFVSEAEPIPARQLKRLRKTIGAVRAALADGTLQIRS